MPLPVRAARTMFSTAPRSTKRISTVTLGRNDALIQLHLLETTHYYSYTCYKRRINTVTLARNDALINLHLLETTQNRLTALRVQVAGNIAASIAKAVATEGQSRLSMEAATQDAYVGFGSEFKKEVNGIKNELEVVDADVSKLDRDGIVTKKAADELVGDAVSSIHALKAKTSHVTKEITKGISDYASQYRQPRQPTPV